MTRERVVIIGGGYGGAMAAARLRTNLAPEHSVILVDPAQGLTERVRLHETAVGGATPPVAYADLFHDREIEHIRARVSRINRADRSVTATNSAGHPMSIPYTRLVIATGSRIDTSSVPGVAEHAHFLGGLETAQKLRQALETLPSEAHVTLCGAGLTGIELAAELAEMFPLLRLTVIDARALGEDLSKRGARVVARYFERHDVRHVVGRVVEVTSDDVKLDDGDAVAHDLVIWCGSFRAASLGADSGLPVNERQQVIVDRTLRTTDPYIFAIGDAAAMPSSPVPLRMACATALPMATHVADVIAAVISGDESGANEPLPFGYLIRCVSLGRKAGLVQFVDRRDVPREIVLSGRIAAWVKRQIVRYTVDSIRRQLKRRSPAEPRAHGETTHGRQRVRAA